MRFARKWTLHKRQLVTCVGRLFCSVALTSPLLCAQVTARQSEDAIPFASILSARGFTTNEEVVQALSDKDPSIRRVAAYRVAELHLPHAADIIRNVLDTERSEVVIVDLSSALWSLGDSDGLTRLKQLCSQRSPSRQVLLGAALQLSFRGKGVICTENLTTEYLQGATLNARRVTMADLENVRREDPSTWAKAVANVAIDSLKDPSIGVRQDAAELLVRFGALSGDKAIATAFARENDPTVRSRLAIVMARFPAVQTR